MQRLLEDLRRRASLSGICFCIPCNQRKIAATPLLLLQNRLLRERLQQLRRTQRSKDTVFHISSGAARFRSAIRSERTLVISGRVPTNFCRLPMLGQVQQKLLNSHNRQRLDWHKNSLKLLSEQRLPL